jgi:hypothetical protein
VGSGQLGAPSERQAPSHTPADYPPGASGAARQTQHARPRLGRGWGTGLSALNPTKAECQGRSGVMRGCAVPPPVQSDSSYRIRFKDNAACARTENHADMALNKVCVLSLANAKAPILRGFPVSSITARWHARGSRNSEVRGPDIEPVDGYRSCSVGRMRISLMATVRGRVTM